MAISNIRTGRNRVSAVCFLALMLIFAAGQPTLTSAADNSLAEFKNILQDSLTVLWTGQTSSPELLRRQDTLKQMLATGGVSKDELEIMTEQSLLTIMNTHKTTRYVLKTLPEHINTLFSPYMDWDGFRKIMWRAISSVAKEDDPVLVRIGTLAPPGTPWLNAPETILLPEIEKLSQGKIRVKIYGGGVMGSDTDVMQKMEDDRLDGCGCSALGVLAAAPDTSALLMPGLFRNYGEIDYIISTFRNRLEKAFEERGYIVGAFVDTGFFYFFSKNKINDLEDLKKQRMLSWFGVIQTTLYQEIGIRGMPVSVPDIVSSLSLGVADASLAPAGWVLGMQAYQYVNYYIKPPLLYSPSAVFVSTGMIERLQKQLGISSTFTHNIQEIIVSEFNAFEPKWNSLIRDYEQKSLQAFETKCGMKVITLSPEDQKRIELASKAVQKKMAGQAFPADLLEDIQKALEAFRAQN